MRILLVEDEIKLAQATKRGLEQEGFAVDVVHDADDGLAYAETEDYDLVILDRMLPDGKDGLDICRALRKNKNYTPALVLTAKDAIYDKVQGLNDGADDYLVKPFSFDELIARVRALHRRPQQTHNTKLTFHGLEISPTDKSVHVNKKPVQLSRKEFSLLEYLAHNPDRTLSKEQIMQHVWNFEADILPNTIEVFIGSLRKKIGKQYIQTVRGFGYRFRGES